MHTIRNNSISHLRDADPLVAAEPQGLHVQPRSLVGAEVEILVAVRLAAGFDLLLEPAAALDLEFTDALVPLVKLDPDANDVLGLFEFVGDLALVVVEALAAAPAGVFAPALVSC